MKENTCIIQSAKSYIDDYFAQKKGTYPQNSRFCLRLNHQAYFPLFDHSILPLIFYINEDISSRSHIMNSRPIHTHEEECSKSASAGMSKGKYPSILVHIFATVASNHWLLNHKVLGFSKSSPCKDQISLAESTKLDYWAQNA